MKELERVDFPPGSTNVILWMTDKTRVVFASLEIRYVLAKSVEDDIEIDFEYDENRKYIRINSDVYSASTRELEKGSWLFFNVAKQDKE